MDELEIILSKIKPSHFIDWLIAEGEANDNIPYHQNVVGMCEYSCLFIAMLLKDEKCADKLFINHCDFSGLMSHYFITYKDDNGEKTVIDLTVSQFMNDMPSLYVKKWNELDSHYKNCYESLSIIDYVRNKRAFQFYVNPLTMEKPSNWFDVNSFSMAENNLFGDLSGFEI